MIKVDGKIVSEIMVEKSDEELASALRGYEAKPFAWWRICLSMLVLVAIGVMVMALVAGFRKKDVLAKVAMCRGMLSVYAVMLIVFAGLYHDYHTQEKYWVSQSEEITFKPEHLGYSLMEYRVAEQMRKEVRERLDMLRR
jgi:hypothetical protein